MTHQETPPTNNNPQAKSTWGWRKRFATLIGLLLLLLIINLLYEPAATWQSIRTSKPDDLLYVSAFDGFIDEWQQSAGRYETQINNGVMRIDIDSEGKLAWSASQPHYADFDAQVTAAAVDGPLDNGFGLIFRLQSQQQVDCNLPLLILCGVSDLSGIFEVPIRLLFKSEDLKASINYYMFLISSDGWYSVWHVVDGQAPTKLSAWIDSSFINQDIGESNQIRVVGRGDQFQFFINGEPVEVCIPDDPAGESTYSGGKCLGQMQLTLTDSRLPTGQIGVVAQTPLFESGVVVEFDNFIVFSPTDTSEQAGART